MSVLLQLLITILTFVSTGFVAYSTYGQVLQAPVVHPGGERTVCFEGHMTVTLEPGQKMVSDPVALQVEAFSELAITFLLKQGESLTGHASAQQTSYVSGVGDVSATPGEVTFIAYPLLSPSWWPITSIDVLPSAPHNAVVAFGTSTTDASPRST